MRNAVDQLMSTLYRKLGNKRYLRDLEQILARLELSNFDEETVRMLARDLELDDTQSERRGLPFR